MVFQRYKEKGVTILNSPFLHLLGIIQAYARAPFLSHQTGQFPAPPQPSDQAGAHPRVDSHRFHLSLVLDAAYARLDRDHPLEFAGKSLP